MSTWGCRITPLVQVCWPLKDPSDTSTTQLCPNKSTIRAYPSCPTIPVYPRSGGGVGSGSWVLLHSRLLLSRTRPRATNCGVKVNIYGLLACHKPPFTHRQLSSFHHKLSHRSPSTQSIWRTLHLIYINTIAATSVLLVLVKLGSFHWTPVPSNLPSPLEPKH